MWVSKNLASKAHDVTLISAMGPYLDIEGRGLPSNLNIIQTIAPSWEGVGAEESHYFMYKSLLEKEYGSGSGIVWDNTWHCFSYLPARKFPKMKIIHTNHGTIEWQRVPVKQLRFPRYIGLSRLHAKYMSTVLKIPVRYIHNGIPLPPIEETTSNGRNGDFLLSINRIIKECQLE